MPSSTLSRSAAVALVLVIALTAFGGVGAAAAQDGEAANGTAENYEIAIDSETRVVSSEWSGDTVTIVVESDVTRQVTVTDASQRLQGAVDIRRQRVTVPGGERVEVEFTVRNEDRPAVTVGTQYGLVGLGSESSSGGLPGISGDSTWRYVQVAALFAALGGGIAIGVVGWSKVADQHDSHEVVRP
ncbi:hypothetical protein [Salinarchaeum laminariae]|uniref:hypothetical protein n=1 Tax=Salinarchaeum laminariae TaxID=869888 RepID=UPI0020BD9854|nr:hypothetical protein [Salinarchaeum laminariae]